MVLFEIARAREMVIGGSNNQSICVCRSTTAVCCPVVCSFCCLLLVVCCSLSAARVCFSSSVVRRRLSVARCPLLVVHCLLPVVVLALVHFQSRPIEWDKSRRREHITPSWRRRVASEVIGQELPRTRDVSVPSLRKALDMLKTSACVVCVCRGPGEVLYSTHHGAWPAAFVLTALHLSVLSASSPYHHPIKNDRSRCSTTTTLSYRQGISTASWK